MTISIDDQIILCVVCMFIVVICAPILIFRRWGKNDENSKK